MNMELLKQKQKQLEEDLAQVKEQIAELSDLKVGDRFKLISDVNGGFDGEFVLARMDGMYALIAYSGSAPIGHPWKITTELNQSIFGIAAHRFSKIK